MNSIVAMSQIDVTPVIWAIWTAVIVFFTLIMLVIIILLRMYEKLEGVYSIIGGHDGVRVKGRGRKGRIGSRQEPVQADK